MMFTFTTLLGASGTLIASGVAGKILSHYGKEDLSKTLHVLTYLGAYGYGLYICFKVVQVAASTFLGIF
jgi:hypothetical protein